MPSKQFSYKIDKLLRRDKEKWPLKINKYRLTGEEAVKETDLGRTEKDPESGNEELVMLGESMTGPSIPYKYMQPRKDGRYEVDIAIPERGVYIPFRKKVNQDSLSEAGVDVEIAADSRNWKRWAEQQFDESAEIVETSQKKWWENHTIMAVMMFIGGGLFYIMLSIAYGEMINKEILQAINSMQKGMLPVIGLGLGRQIKEMRDKQG